VPQATLMAARAYQEASDCTRAIPHYQAYLSYGSVLADMIHERIGDCLAAGGRLDDAAAAYRQGIEATDDKSVQVGLQEKIAGIYLAQAEYASAAAEYDAILAVARIKEYRAKIEYLAGQALAATGDVEGALTRYRLAVELDPAAEYAYLSLIQLVDAGVEVDEFQRGLVDYNAGAKYPDALGAAISAFDRYLAARPVDRADAAFYYKALAQRALEQPEAALETLGALISRYPKSTYLPQAWLEKGATLASMGQNDAAIKAYQDLASFFPAHNLAPEALRRAARLRQGEGAYGEAAKLYENLQASFPGFEDADEALWSAGLMQYRAGNVEQAIVNWQSLLNKYPKSAYRAKTLYWLGKLDTKAKSQSGGSYWDQLVAADPHAYYALRAQQIRAGDSLTITRLITAPVEPPNWNAARAEAVMLDWLRGWTQVPTDTERLTLPVTVTRRLDFRRGEALLAAGFRREALGAFDGVRAAAWSDPLMLARLSLFFHDLGLHGLAARTASRLAALAPKRTIYEAPTEVQRLAYPLVYADLLSAEARERGLDPLLLAALVRQESLFEPVAESYAGARGLGQVMPATGEGIARSLGVENFALDDLYRPAISIRFGAYYLGVQMGRFDDQILVGLAAYNGGPGNTLHWLETTGDDLDLFVEAITATQSRIYLQRVYEQYLVYERLYRSAGSAEP
jgi:peptidoglycan lytic transglycosylase